MYRYCIGISGRYMEKKSRFDRLHARKASTFFPQMLMGGQQRDTRARTCEIGVRLCHELFVSFPQKRNGIVFSSGVNYLHSVGNIQSELSSYLLM